jgi:hypothetical protein
MKTLLKLMALFTIVSLSACKKDCAKLQLLTSISYENKI